MLPDRLEVMDMTGKDPLPSLACTGPYTDMYLKTSREAKQDERLKESGPLLGFRYGDFDWPLNPQTAFYDWLYLSALRQNPILAQQLLVYDGFSDIEFNPDKSINCQAASAALYKAFVERHLLDLPCLLRMSSYE